MHGTQSYPATWHMTRDPQCTAPDDKAAPEKHVHCVGQARVVDERELGPQADDGPQHVPPAQAHGSEHACKHLCVDSAGKRVQDSIDLVTILIPEPCKARVQALGRPHGRISLFAQSMQRMKAGQSGLG